MRAAITPTQFDFHELAYHFLALSAADRFLRFGRVSSDVEVVAYAETLLRGGETVFVIVEPAPSIVGVVHLEITEGIANLGLSVSDWARRQGVGGLLLGRAGLFAISRGISTLFVRNLDANPALRSLAHRVGMKVAAAPDAKTPTPERPAGTSDHVYAKYIAGRITLADHAARLQMRTRPSADALSVAILESSAW